MIQSMAATDGEPGAVLTAESGAAFKSRSFRNYQLARFLVILGAEAQSIAVAWQIYQITHSALLLGATGWRCFCRGCCLCCRRGTRRTGMTARG